MKTALTTVPGIIGQPDQCEPKTSVIIMSWMWVAILACVPIYRLEISSLSSRIPDLISLLLIACMAFGHFKSSALVAKWRFAVVCIPLAALFSGVNSNLNASILVAIKFVVLLWFSPMVFSFYRNAIPPFIGRVLVGFVGVQTLSAVAGLLQLAGIPILGMVANSGRANGLAGHPNVLGLMCVVAILICLGVKADGKHRIIRFFLATINAAALVGTGSISSMIAMGVSLVVLVVSLRAASKFIFTVLILGVISLVIAALAGVDSNVLLSPVESRVQEVTGESDGVASFDIRQRTYDFALESISEDPFSGVGLDGANQGTFNGVTVVHNYLLRAWYQGGIFMIISFSLISLVLITHVIRSLIAARNAVAASVVVAVLTFGLTSAFYEQQQYWFLLMLALVSFDYIGDELQDSQERANDERIVRTR
ncbi:O-antigen ligase family protein [Rhodococcus sp. NPDC056743]|uniref:O-antigen ligase family protein n=1 Tax=Rhodococcus sp. NPDC056743 TaxID=3345934 RepID=UPI0036734F5C